MRRKDYKSEVSWVYVVCSGYYELEHGILYLHLQEVGEPKQKDMLMRRKERKRSDLVMFNDTLLRNCKNKVLSSPGDIWKEGRERRRKGGQAKVFCGLQKQEFLLDNWGQLRDKIKTKNDIGTFTKLTFIYITELYPKEDCVYVYLSACARNDLL